MAHIDTPETQKANRRFIKRAMRVPLLDQERELELAQAWKKRGDESALHELTQAYMRLVISMAARFRNYGLPMGDLIQEGNIGLMQAAARFDPDRDVRFSTYASWWIRSSMQDYILRNWSIVRTGTTAAQKSLFFNLRRLRALIDSGTEAQLSPGGRRQIAEQLGVPEKDVESMEARLAAADRSLNAAFTEEGGGEWQDLLADERAVPEEEVMSARDNERRSHWINQALEHLNERELTIIRERRLQDESVTLETLGRRLGISKERVRQIEHQALKKLKKALLSQHRDPVEAGLLEAD
ncbi:MAG: RNA polymerase factor sigma-32 [Alphaproteobacteria bacterium]